MKRKATDGESFVLRCHCFSQRGFERSEVDVHPGGDGEDEPTDEALEAFELELVEHFTPHFASPTVEANSECDYLVASDGRGKNKRFDFQVAVEIKFVHAFTARELKPGKMKAALEPTQKALNKVGERVEEVLHENYMYEDFEIIVERHVPSSASQ